MQSISPSAQALLWEAELCFVQFPRPAAEQMRPWAEPGVEVVMWRETGCDFQCHSFQPAGDIVSAARSSFSLAQSLRGGCRYSLGVSTAHPCTNASCRIYRTLEAVLLVLPGIAGPFKEQTWQVHVWRRHCSVLCSSGRTCVGVWRRYFLFASEQRSLLENHPLAASVLQWMLPTSHLAQRHSQLGNRHYERKIMAQHFSPGGTMGLFSPCHGMSRRTEAAELYFWSWSSITERLCAMWMCQLDWSNLEPSALCCFTCCRHQHSHSFLLIVSSIPLPLHCCLRVVASPGITGDKKGVPWSGFSLFYQ